MKLLHPFCPFITEEIYDKLFDDSLIIKETFPEYDANNVYEKEESSLQYIKEVITSIRNRRAELNVPHDKKPDIIVETSDGNIKEMYELCANFIKTLAQVNNISFTNNIDNIDKYISLTFEKSNVYIPFDELVNIEEEKIRLQTEIKKVESEINRAKGMLSNEKFISKAPEAKVLEEKEKLKKYEQMLIDLKNTLEKL